MMDGFVLPLGLVAASHVVAALATLFRLALLTKILGAEAYGIWSVISVTVSLLVPFASVVLRISLVRFLAAETDEERIASEVISAYTLVLIVGGALSLLGVAIGIPMAHLVFGTSVAVSTVLLASSLIVIASLQELPFGYFRMRERMGLFALLTALQSVGETAGIAVFLALGFRLDGVLLGSGIAGLLFSAASFALILREVGWRRPRLSLMSRYVRWGLPLAPNAAITWIIHASDRYVIGALLGVTAAGIYNAAYQISSFATFLLAAIMAVSYPKIIKSYDDGDLDATRTHIERAIRYVVMFSIPSAAGLSVLAYPLLRLLTSGAFTSGTLLVPFVAFGSVLFALYQVVITIVHIANRTQLTVRLLGATAAANIVLNLLLVPRLGFLGAAVATLVSYGFLAATSVFVTRRLLHYRIDLPFAARATISSGGMALVVWLTRGTTAPRLILSIASGVLSYGALLLLLGGLNHEEKAYGLSVVRRLIRRA